MNHLPSMFLSESYSADHVAKITSDARKALKNGGIIIVDVDLVDSHSEVVGDGVLETTVTGYINRKDLGYAGIYTGSGHFLVLKAL